MAYTSTIANELLVTPFDDKSAVSQDVTNKLTKEEFCNQCYSKPMFEKELQQYLQEESMDENNDSSINYDEIRNQIHRQRTSYDNFEKWLNNFEDCKIYTINGNAGTGKSTFVNYKKFKEREIEWIILDVYLARSFDEWMSDIRTDISHFERAQSKVYGSVMNKLWEIIFQGLDGNGCYSLQVVYDNLIKLTENYKNRYFHQYPSGRKLLDEVCKVLENNEDMVSKVETSAKLFKKYVNGKIEIEGNELINILNIFLLTLRCMSDDLEKRYVIIFDNFERFITKDEMYNKDVDKIRLLLASYIKRINQGGNLHKAHFKFAMAIRDSTARMCGVRLHVSDSEASNLDLGKWYEIQDIINLKKKWYADNHIPIKNSDIVEQIIGDLRTCRGQIVTGLKLLIDSLFNDNKRLILDFIGSMVELPSNSKNIEKYKNLWDENTSESRFAARSIIRGMILDELEKKPDKLFEKLKTYSTRNTKNGIGDARKILTILYNYIHKGNENEISLVTVLSELFGSDVGKIWENENSSNKRKTISDLLFYMNSYNRRENDWIQFIDIQFKKSNCNIVVEDSDELERILSEDMKNCTLHLMPAGEAYLMYIAASFEFFSLRYVPDYVPLFALIPTPEEIKQYGSVKELPCYKKVECVTKYAGQCIELLQTKEDTIKLHIDNSGNGKYHYTRIINFHTSYIDAFVKYIMNKYCNTNEIDESVKDKYEILCREITFQRKKYNKYERNENRFSGR